MEYIFLGKSKLKVSRLCMGGCPMGQYGWGEVKEPELIEAVNTAIDNGITMFDTADTYGLGKSEETLGKALGVLRKNVVIASKFGVRVENGKTFYDNSPEYIGKALEASLKRLKTDYIDLYQIHYLDRITPIEKIVETLEYHKRNGKIREFGISNIHINDLNELKPFAGKFVSIQDEYSLACRKNEQDLIKLSGELNVTPMTWGSLGQGVLTGKYNEDSVFDKNDRRSREIYVNFHGEKFAQNLKIVDVMRLIANKHDIPLSAVAVRFILDYIKDSVVLVGIKRPEQIINNIKSMGWNLTTEELQTLCKVSL